MTTKPKARKFRIKRNSVSRDAEQSPAEPPQATPPRVPPRSAQPATGDIASSNEATVEDEIDAIRKEQLTGRQLRLARRVAQKNNIKATSDFDAVRLLRQAGIDPFSRSNMLELVVPRDSKANRAAIAGAPPGGTGAENPDGEQLRVQLPQTRPDDAPQLPSTELSPTEQRNIEISTIQRDIARRRRKKLALLISRLAFFVFLPTFLCGWYFYNMATPLFATKSEFLILQADNAGGGGIGGLLSGTQFATSQDSIAVQSYLESKDAMLRLDEDLSFKDHFKGESIDVIQRLADDASNEEAYRTYKRMIQIGYDPTEGVIRMEVVAADPQVAKEFSARLIAYAEERVNKLSAQKRDDQMGDARTSFENAQYERRSAQEALVQLQQRGAILDPEGVITSLRTQISNVEVQLQDRELVLAALLDNARPNAARVAGAEGDIRRLRDLLDQLNRRMINVSEGENSLAQLSVQIQMAQADLATRDMMLQSALQQLEQTRMEAARQVRYLTTSVEPVASEDPSYPRKFENTILAFLIFAGIYLLISLTASILREQVTS